MVAKERYAAKIALFKAKLGSASAPSISFWGPGFGPIPARDGALFDEYGPSVQYPGWLFGTSDSLGMVPAVPNNVSEDGMRLRLHHGPNGRQILCWSGPNGVKEKAIQSDFSDTSDYVVVTIDPSLNSPLKRAEIQATFSKIHRPDKRLSDVLIVESPFSLSPRDVLGMESAIDALAQHVLGPGDAWEVRSARVFDVSSLATLDGKNYNFVY